MDTEIKSQHRKLTLEKKTCQINMPNNKSIIVHHLYYILYVLMCINVLLIGKRGYVSAVCTCIIFLLIVLLWGFIQK